VEHLLQLPEQPRGADVEPGWNGMLIAAGAAAGNRKAAILLHPARGPGVPDQAFFSLR